MSNLSSQVSQNKITSSASKVMAANVLCLITGLASQVVVAGIFGAGVEIDAFLTALTVPAYLQAILLSSLSFVFIPTFIRSQSSGKESEAWALAGTMFWIVGIVLSILTIFGVIFANQIIHLITPGFIGNKSYLTANLMQVMMLSFPLMGLAELSTGIQNARGRFFWPAAASGIGSLVNLAVVWLGYPMYGAIILAWANLFSMLTQALIVTIPVIRHGWQTYLPINHHQVAALGRLAMPLIMFGVFTRITPVFERYFASGLPDGEISYLGYASKISMIISSVIGAGIATAIFPVMAHEYSHHGTEGLKKINSYALKLSYSIGFPTFLILSALAIPLVSVLFQRGAFIRSTSEAVAVIIPYTLLVVLLQMTGNVLGRSFYVMGNTFIVPFVASIASVLYVFLAYMLRRLGGGYVSLAIAQAIQWGSIVLILSIIVTKKRLIDWVAISQPMLSYFGIAVLAAFIAIQSASLFDRNIFQFVAGAFIGGTLYYGLIFYLDRKMALNLLNLFGFDRITIIGRLWANMLKNRILNEGRD